MIRLPPTPPIIEIKKEELLRKRMRKGKTRSRLLRGELYQAVAKAKGILNGGSCSDALEWLSEIESATSYRIRALSPMTYLTYFPDRGKDLTIPMPPVEEAVMERRAPPSLVKFDIGKSLSEKIRKENVFLDFLGTVERSCRRFILKHKQRWEFIVEEIADVEEPEWRRIVLIAKPPPNLSLDDILKLWDSLDDEVRKPLEHAISSMPELKATAMRSLEESLYIEVDLC